VDRLIAIVALRFRLDLRAILGVKSRLAGFAVSLPFLFLGSAAASFFVFVGARAVEHAHPEWLLPGASALATVVGLFWALSPLLAGVAFSETHDLTRLLHFPVPFSTLVLSSLVANLVEPMALAKLPPLVAAALAVGGGPLTTLPALVAVLLGFVFTLAAAQVTGLVLLGLARHRRWQDRALFVGLAFGFGLSVLPLLLTAGGGRALRGVLRYVLERDVFVVSPFGWGARAAVHVGRGELVPFAFFTAATGLAVVGAGALAVALAKRIYEGELDLGEPVAEGRGSRMILSGSLGALVEKDLRVTWRDPRLKALLFTGLLGPLIPVLFVWQGMRGLRPTALFFIASFVGLGTYGANALALERRGLLLLAGFPLPRWQIFVAKNLGAILLRLPGLLLLVAASLLAAPPLLAPAVGVACLVTMLLCCGADNFIAILFPVPVAPAGGAPHPGGGRGLGAAALATLLMFAALAISAPFVFLAWLPWLLGRPWLAMVTLPVGLSGALAVYGMLVAGAAGLFSSREPEFLEAALVEP